MPWDPIEPFQRAEAEYMAAHGGRSSLEEAHLWAQAMVAWHAETNFSWGSRPATCDPAAVPLSAETHPVLYERTVFVLAHRIRIEMCNRRVPAADVPLAMLVFLLSPWHEYRSSDHQPLPPWAWPSPPGAFGDRLSQVLRLYGGDQHEQWREVIDATFEVLEAHEWHEARHHRSHGLALTLDRLERNGVTQTVLADRAGLLGISPVAVTNHADYAGYDLDLITAPFARR